MGAPAAGGTCSWEGLTGKFHRSRNKAELADNSARKDGQVYLLCPVQGSECWMVAVGKEMTDHNFSWCFLVSYSCYYAWFRSSDDNWSVEKHHSKRCRLFLDAVFELPSYNCWVKKNILLVSLISKGKTTQLTTVKYESMESGRRQFHHISLGILTQFAVSKLVIWQ